MNLGSLEMLSTLESLAEKLSTGHLNNKGIILDNNGNKISTITRLDKIQQHPYQNHNRSSPNGNINKFIEK